MSHILIGVAVVLAFGLNLLALRGRDAAVLVAVADRAIPEGSTIDTDRVRLVPISADFEGLSGLITEDELASFEGRVTSRSFEEGALLDETALIAGGVDDGLRTMSIPVPVEHAAGARIANGDRVDVISLTDGSARFVATDLLVVSHAEPESTGLGATSYFVTVAVDADQALALAEAIGAGSVELVRSTGASPVVGES
jgi:Flp pilus assembly protein CpaB